MVTPVYCGSSFTPIYSLLSECIVVLLNALFLFLGLVNGEARILQLPSAVAKPLTITPSFYRPTNCMNTYYACHASVRPSVLLSVTFVHCVKTPTRPIGLQQHTQSCAHDQIICFQHPWFIIRRWRFADSFQFRPIVDASQTILVEIDWENRSFEVIRGLARSWFLGKRQTVEAVELL